MLVIWHLHVPGSLDQPIGSHAGTCGSQVVPAAEEPRTLYRGRKASEQPLVDLL